MATASTKRRPKKGGAGAKRAGAAAERAQGVPAPARLEISENVWLVASLCILAAAALLRLYALELRPMHHDEAVNGFFLTSLFREGRYSYDPTNYHGPTIYYFALPTVYAFGLTTFAVRLVPVFFGVGLVWLALCLRRWVGPLGALTAAALLAVSPGTVFYSRYFIHEMMFLFFALGAVVGLLHFYDTGRAEYLLLASAALALHFATKETAFITAVVLLLATLIAWVYAGYMRGRAHPLAGREASRGRGTGGGERLGEVVRRLGGWRRLEILLFAALALFVVVNVLFYSSFFTNAKGVGDSLEALKVWTKTGTSEFHGKPWHTYLKWLLQEESPLLLLGAVGAALALWSGRNRFAVFAGAWAFGTLAAYSIVPYKTPWLALNFTVPLAVAAGYAVQELAETFGRDLRPAAQRLFPAAALVVALCLIAAGVWRITSAAAGGPGLLSERGALAALVAAALVVGWCVWSLYAASEGGAWRRSAPALSLAAVAVAVCTYQAWVVSFRQYDNDQYPYVYAHTRREFLNLVGEIERLVARAGTGTDTRIASTAPGPGTDSYWPLPWYLNSYRNVGYFAQLPADAANLSVVVGNATQDAQLRATIGATHRRVGPTYPLRPGVELILYAQRGLADR